MVIWYLMRIVGVFSIRLIMSIMPQPRVKAEPVKKLATIHAKERGISTSIVARADDSITNFDFVIVILKNLFIQPTRFQGIKKYFKKRIENGL